MAYEDSLLRQMRGKASRYAQPRGTVDEDHEPATRARGAFMELREENLFADFTNAMVNGFTVDGVTQLVP